MKKIRLKIWKTSKERGKFKVNKIITPIQAAKIIQVLLYETKP